MAISVPVTGINGNRNAALWERRAADPDWTYHNPTDYSGGYGSWLFRIPQSCKCANGDILEFAEMHARDSDHGCGAIYMKRTSDGINFTRAVAVYKLPTYLYDSDYINSPCPVVLGNGRVVLVWSRTEPATSGMRLYAMYSDDHGYTWSAAAEITSSVTHASTLYTGNITSITNSSGTALLTCSAAHGLTDGKTYKITIANSSVAGYNGTYVISGAGNVPSGTTIKITGLSYTSDAGAQGTWTLKSLWNIPTDGGTLDANGRALIPGDHRYTTDTSGLSFSHVLGTTDGVTFSVVGSLDETKAANQGTNECTIGKFANDTLYMNIRMLSGSSKGYSTSTDHGATWADCLLADGGGGRPSMPASSCDGAVCQCADGTVYVAWERDTSTRAGLTIAKLDSNAVTIAAKKTVIFGLAGYLSVQEIDANTLGVSFERGHDPAYSSVTYQEIGWVRVPKAWIEESDTAPTNPYVVDFWLNEFTSGAVPSVGSPIIGQGYDQRGRGQSSGNAVYDGDNGLQFDGNTAHPPVRLSESWSGRTEPSLFTPGLGSITIEIEFKSSTSSGTRMLLDTHNSSGQGVNLYFNVAGSALHRPTLRLNDGTTTLSLGGTSGTNNYDSDGNWHTAAFCYVRGGTCAVYYDGVLAFQTADTLSSSVVIRGSDYASLGRSSSSATNAFTGWIRRIRVTKGQLYTGSPPSSLPALITVGQTKTSRASYLGSSSPSVPANAPTATGRVLWLAPSYDKGFSSSTDYYGGYDPPPVPVRHGQGVSSVRDATGSALWAGISSEDYSATWWEIDEHLGQMLRVAPHSATIQASRFQPFTLTTAYDAPQNTGTFTLIFPFRFLQDSIYRKTLLDNTIRTASNPGFCFDLSTANKPCWYMPGGASNLWCNLSSGFTGAPTLVPGNAYLLVVRGIGAPTNTIQLSYASISGGRVGTITHCTPDSMTNRAGTNNSAFNLTMGSLPDGSNICDLGIKDVMLYSTTLSDNEINSLQGFLANILPGASPRYGYGYGYGY